MSSARIAHLRAAIVETLERRFPGATAFVLVRERVRDRQHRARAVAELEDLDADPFEAEGPGWCASELLALEQLARGLGATRTQRDQLPKTDRQRIIDRRAVQ